MGQIQRLSRGTAKPYASLPRIDWTHPLAENLVTYFYDTGGGDIVDLVNGQSAIFSPGTGSGVLQFRATLSATKSGRSWQGNGVGFLAQGAINPKLAAIGVAPYSGAAGYVRTGSNAGGNYGAIFACSDAATFTPVWLASNPSSNVICAFFSDPTFAFASALNQFATTATVFTTSTSGTAYHIDPVNGFNSVTNTVTLSTTTNLFPTFYNEGTVNSAGTDVGFVGAAFYGAAWTNRALTQAEVVQLSGDPWCFLIYPEDDMFAMIGIITPPPVVVARPWGNLPMMGVG